MREVIISILELLKYAAALMILGISIFTGFVYQGPLGAIIGSFIGIVSAIVIAGIISVLLEINDNQKELIIEMRRLNQTNEKTYHVLYKALTPTKTAVTNKDDKSAF